MDSTATPSFGKPFIPADYSSFVFDDVEGEKDRYVFRYRLVGKSRVWSFAEVVDFDDGHDAAAHSGHRAALELYHQMAGVSYVKTAGVSTLESSVSCLDRERAEFLEMLYTRGLGEFSYRNGLDLQFRCALRPGSLEAPSFSSSECLRVLLPFGGGKDSLLSLQLLEEAGFEATLFVVGPNPVAEFLAERTGRPLIRVRRHLDPGLREINSQGALNGHVPVTALVAGLAVLVALRRGFSAVVFSNEASANRGGLYRGREVNHQFAKSLEFERAFQRELLRTGLGAVSCFSLLRPFTEGTICREFARRGRFLDGFVSCNRNFRRDQKECRPAWCLRCPKCLFVHLALAPHLAGDVLDGIFGQNPLHDMSLLDGYQALLNVAGTERPFECVGEPEEVREAFEALLQGRDTRTWPVVRHYGEHWRRPDASVGDLSPKVFCGEHCVPVRFQGALDAVHRP